MKPYSGPPRTLFVKQSFDPFGPWSPVDWAAETPASILRKFLYKVTLWEMTCVLQADWRIVRPTAPSPFSEYVARLEHLAGLLATWQTQTVDLTTIDFGEYELVISLEPCIPPTVIDRFPSTAFAYFLNEHRNQTYGEHLASRAAGYRTFLDHMCGDVPARSSALPMPYLRAPDIARGRAPVRTAAARPRVWVEARTLLDAALGDPRAVWTERCDELAATLADRHGVEIRYRPTIYRGFYNVPDPASNDAQEYLDALAAADSFISLSAAGAGQTLCDAASLGLPCVGTKALVYHRMICAPAATTTSLELALATVGRWHDRPGRRAAVVEHQDARLAKVMRKDPLRALKRLVAVRDG
ncbi:MAG: hypothetical protein HY657_03080 [Acidobacteria bacterium]|nr:hypothetical protein [Acidobacteriota bacterium]